MSSARFNEQTYYEILEVEPGAPQNEIHLAYQRAKNTYSPDSPALLTMFSEAEAKALLSLIEEAFETLSNQTRRRKYDASLMSPSSNEPLPDFDPSDSSQKNDDGKINVLKKREKLPEGFAKTKFSVYEVDENFENEIKTTEVVDGPLLQKIRLYKQINLEQVSNETRISKSYLSALESNDYDGLPAGVFVRGFVVQVARSLGLDEQKFANLYMKKFKADNSEN